VGLQRTNVVVDGPVAVIVRRGLCLVIAERLITSVSRCEQVHWISEVVVTVVEYTVAARKFPIFNIVDTVCVQSAGRGFTSCRVGVGNSVNSGPLLELSLACEIALSPDTGPELDSEVVRDMNIGGEVQDELGVWLTLIASWVRVSTVE
jgi:hypothetical protein